MQLEQNSYRVVIYYPYVCLANPIVPDPGGGLAQRRLKKKKSPRKILPVEIKQQWSIITHFNEFDIEEKLRHYVLSPLQQQQLGYPIESEVYKGRAIIYHPFPPYDNVKDPRCNDSGSGSSGSEEVEDDAALTDPSVRSDERRCSRCGRGFFLLQDKYLTTERCVYHWGKHMRHMGYACCNGAEGSPGCSTAKLHVWSGVETGVNRPLDGFVSTQPRQKQGEGHGVYAIDCEMCYTTQGLELCKVSVVSFNRRVHYNTYVKPDTPVIDYNTRFSGVTSKHLQKNSSVKTIKEVQADILEFVSADTILVGHGLENDLKALKIFHQNVVDTAIAFPHHYGLPYRHSLRSLVNNVLHRDIQTVSHDSIQDAVACIDLMLYRLNCDFNTQQFTTI